MKRYSDLEIDLLIDEISGIAVEAIERAAAEAAKAAFLASVEREAAALREAQRWKIEADLRRQALAETKAAGRKNIVLAALIGIVSGLSIGVGGTILISR